MRFHPGVTTEKLNTLYTKDIILQRVAALADQISHDYPSGDLLLVGVLKGAFVFLADLVRAIRVPLAVDFVLLSSYRNATTSSGKIRILKDMETSATERDIVIVEDIIDTGLTMTFLKKEILKRKPRSLKVCALLDKKFRRQVPLEADYVGIIMEKDHFVVGYGLDFSERFRDLPEICYLE
jgi:hypoxanthine phosphoribosyltransferase